MSKKTISLTSQEESIRKKLINNFEFPPTKDQDWLFNVLSKFLFSNKSNCTLILSGYAGTGKTTCINSIVKTAKTTGLKPVLLAPTGRAAKVMSKYCNAPAFTIHKHIYKKLTVKGKAAFYPTENKLKNALYIIDEASMISANDNMGTNLLDDLIEHIFSVEDAKLIFVGDEAQLPPVGSFKSPALDLNFLRDTYHITAFQVRLREVVRQDSLSGILYEATKLRVLLEEGTTQNIQFENHGDFKLLEHIDFQDTLESKFSEYGKENVLIITRSNMIANKFNQQIRVHSLGMEEEISVGDLVMVTKNNYFWPEKNRSSLNFIANGDVAKITDIKRDEQLHGFRFSTIKIKFLDYEKIFPLECLANLDSIHVNGPSLPSAEMSKLYNSLLVDYAEESRPKFKVMTDPHFNALQLKFAYAVTCHKSQGGQWDVIFIDGTGIKNMENYIEIIRWLYTAVTRAVKEVYLINFPEEFFLN